MNELKIYCEDINCMPERQHETDAGLDLRSAFEYKVKHGTHEKVATGIYVEIPVKHVGLIFPRSGLATKEGLTLANTVGVIDSDYRGEIICAINYIAPPGHPEYKTINKYTRIAQLVIVPIITPKPIFVNNLTSTKRGEGGFGHTGKH